MRLVAAGLMVLAIAAMTSGCGRARADDDGTETGAEPTIADPPATAVAPVVGGVLALLDGVDCPGSGAGCAEVEATYDPARFDWPQASAAQTILLVDEQAAPLAAMKYRSRVRGVFALDGEGALTPRRPSVRMPAYLDAVLERLAHAGYVPVRELEPLARRLAPASRDLETRYGAGHGTIPFQHLAESNPQATFVLLESPQLARIFRREFCAKDAPAFRARIATVSAAIRRDLLAAYGIDFVNWSAGQTPATVRDDWNALCQGVLRDRDADRLLRAYMPLYEAFFATPGVIGVQAGTDGSLGRSPLDCETAGLPLRVRAGYFLALDSRLGPDGRREDDGGDLDASVPPAQRAVEACLDVLVNFGVKDVRPFPYDEAPLLLYDVLSLSAYPINFGHTSWAAPLALSRLVHERALHPEVDVGDAVRGVVPRVCGPNGSDPCKYQDPLRNRQTEAQRLYP
jgi:hypothetical protein